MHNHDLSFVTIITFGLYCVFGMYMIYSALRVNGGFSKMHWRVMSLVSVFFVCGVTGYLLVTFQSLGLLSGDEYYTIRTSLEWFLNVVTIILIVATVYFQPLKKITENEKEKLKYKEEQIKLQEKLLEINK